MPAISLSLHQAQDLRSGIAAGRTLNEMAAQIGLSMRALRYYCLDHHIPVPPEEDDLDGYSCDARAIAIACQKHLNDLARYHQPPSGPDANVK